MRFFFLLSCILAWSYLFGQSWVVVFADDVVTSVNFSRDIKPILSNTCYRCHGPDAAERKGGANGLRLDTAEGIFADLGGRSVVVPGKPELSELLKRVSSADADEAMPPKRAGKRLTLREIGLLNAWIKQGAKFTQHWSYVTPVRPQLPIVSDSSWGKNAIDRFILARLDREGLKPSPEADRPTLARRVSLDVTGLPPTLDEVDAFVKDTTPNAYESFVDRMLAKSAYGEHWGLLWLDLARYADSAGYADDPARVIWLFRDYVIKSFNANKPFDQMTLEQIAGDLLPNPTDDQLIATAFHRNTLTNNEGGTNDEEFRNVAIVDRVNTTMAVWMGTTIACAQCHTHKYDPITQEEYFRFFAFFNNTDDADRRDESPLHSLFTEEQKQQRSAYQGEIVKLEPLLKTVTPELAAAEASWDQAFPRSIGWMSLKPLSVQTQSQVTTTIADDGTVKVTAGAKNDTYTIEVAESVAYRQFVWLDPDRLRAFDINVNDVIRAFREQKLPVFAEQTGPSKTPEQSDFQLPTNSPDLKSIEELNKLVIKQNASGLEVPFGALGRITLVRVPVRAFRLDALPDSNLPGKGPGHADGNFAISKITVKVTPPAGSSLLGRYVRVELPGDKFLSLAEVQVFSGTENIAPKGDAQQISTDFGGEAKRAIDGNTDGNYFAANSTTHTAAGKDPWWELDFKAEQPIDRLVIWNRTDGVSDRLANFRVMIFNDQHELVWRNDVAAPPNPNTEFRVTGPRTIELDKAIADYSQPTFDPANVLIGKDSKAKGWAVGGATGTPHSLTLIAKKAVEIPAGGSMTITIEHVSDLANHTLAHFALLATDEPRVEEWARTPANILASLKILATERSPTQKDDITQHFLTIAPELEPTRRQLATVRKSLNDVKPDTVPVMKELTENRRMTKLQHRGNFMDLGQEVTEGIPSSFSPLPSDAPRNRLTLAKWLVDSNNPLTARVLANRYWEQLFGIGIVATSEDFGSQGDQPFHPELLDWLACELAGITGDANSAPAASTQLPWDLKAFLKLLVMSSAYRQSSKMTPDLEQKDPDNRLLARGPRFRLSAEALRDQALFASGLISSKMFGPPVKPPQPNLGLSAAFGSSTDWQTSTGEDRYRRGIYTTWRRSNPYPSMATFDAPNREVCTVRRVRTNTPLQALVTLNDPAYIEAAQALARRIVKDGGATTLDRVNYGFRRVLLRSPHPNELARLVQLYEQSIVRFGQNAEDAKRMATEPLGPANSDANVTELAAWTVVGNVLMNLDEYVMKP